MFNQVKATEGWLTISKWRNFEVMITRDFSLELYSNRYISNTVSSFALNKRIAITHANDIRIQELSRLLDKGYDVLFITEEMVHVDTKTIENLVLKSIGIDAEKLAYVNIMGLNKLSTFFWDDDDKNNQDKLLLDLKTIIERRKELGSEHIVVTDIDEVNTRVMADLDIFTISIDNAWVAYNKLTLFDIFTLLELTQCDIRQYIHQIKEAMNVELTITEIPDSNFYVVSYIDEAGKLQTFKKSAVNKNFKF
ncbi:hypothetical protein D3C81_07220 [compost metagenome]